MMRTIVLSGVFCALTATFNAVHACPVCNEPLGQQVRAGIFDETFGSNLVATLFPFAIFLGVVAAIHGGGKGPCEGQDVGPQTSPSAANDARTSGARS
ncbi:hypothetical protein AB1L88_11425 [Tautonia sp. JC769]|uniref:hypothetical protein n=1 Tax=Tautonia sp. JC769 TaxID=3232135 RepID=UPI003458079C